MSLDATAGGAAANSYVTTAEADAYFATRMGADAWAEADDPEAALITATERLEQESYRGQRATDTQALKFPRSKVVIDGVELDDTTVPLAVKKACCEAAIALLEDEDVFSGSDLKGFNSIQTQDVKFELRHGVEGALPDRVKTLLKDFLISHSEVIRN